MILIYYNSFIKTIHVYNDTVPPVDKYFEMRGFPFPQAYVSVALY